MRWTTGFAWIPQASRALSGHITRKREREESIGRIRFDNNTLPCIHFHPWLPVLIAPCLCPKSSTDQTMPLEQQHVHMDDDEEVRRMGRGVSSNRTKSIPKPRTQEWGDDAGPTSPRVRKRLDDAKENANLFAPGNPVQLCGWLERSLETHGRWMQCVSRAK